MKQQQQLPCLQPTHTYKRNFFQFIASTDPPYNNHPNNHQNQFYKSCQFSQHSSTSENISYKEYQLARSFCCPFSQSKLKEPVILSDGYSYEKQYVQRLLNPTRISRYQFSQQNSPNKSEHFQKHLNYQYKAIPSPVNPIHYINPQIQIQNKTLKMALEYIENFIQRDRVQFVTYKKESEINIHFLHFELETVLKQLQAKNEQLQQKIKQLGIVLNDLIRKNQRIQQLQRILELEPQNTNFKNLNTNLTLLTTNQNGQNDQIVDCDHSKPQSIAGQQKEVFISENMQKPQTIKKTKEKHQNQSQRHHIIYNVDIKTNKQQQLNSSKNRINPNAKSTNWRLSKLTAPIIDILQSEGQNISQNPIKHPEQVDKNEENQTLPIPNINSQRFDYISHLVQNPITSKLSLNNSSNLKNKTKVAKNDFFSQNSQRYIKISQILGKRLPTSLSSPSVDKNLNHNSVNTISKGSGNIIIKLPGPNLTLSEKIKSQFQRKQQYPHQFPNFNRPEVIRCTTNVVQFYAKKAPHLTYNKDRFYLKHKQVKIDFSLMTQYDWTELQILQIFDCDIDDEQFALFTKNALLFPCLEFINLVKNRITNISKEFLNFNMLKYVNFGTDKHNKLTPESIDILMTLRKQNHHLTLIYQKMFDYP